MSDETVKLSKNKPGTDSFGHVWAKAGAVVEVTLREAEQLLAIPDGGFAVTDGSHIVVERPRGLTQSAAAAGFGPPVDPDEGDEGTEVTEPAPEVAAVVTEPAPKKPPAHASGRAGK